MCRARSSTPLVEAVEDVGRGEVAPDAPHPPAQRGRQRPPARAGHPDPPSRVHGARRGARGTRRWRRCALDDGRELLGHPPGGQIEVAFEVEVERRVQEDRRRSRPVPPPPPPRPAAAGAVASKPRLATTLTIVQPRSWRWRSEAGQPTASSSGCGATWTRVGTTREVRPPLRLARPVVPGASSRPRGSKMGSWPR